VLKPKLKTANDKYVILVGIELEDAYSIEKVKFISSQMKTNTQLIILSKRPQNLTFESSLNTISKHWRHENRARLIGGYMTYLYSSNQLNEDELQAILSQTSAMYDAGDYQMESNKFSGWTANMMANMILAKRYSIPFYILSQSVSPFNYPRPFNWFLKPLMKSAMKIPHLHCVREDWGHKACKKFLPDSKRCISDDILFYQKYEQKIETKSKIVFAPKPETVAKIEWLAPILQEISNSNNQLGMNDYLLALPQSISPEHLSKIRKIAANSWKIKTFEQVEYIDSMPKWHTDSIVFTDCNRVAFLQASLANPALFLKPNRISQSLYENLYIKEYLLDSFKNLTHITIDKHNEYQKSCGEVISLRIKKSPLPIEIFEK